MLREFSVSSPTKRKLTTRTERVEEAQRLRAEGLILREIAQAMGAAVSTVDGWLNDPDGSRLAARKRSYQGTCRVCGGATTGCDGRDKAPDLCKTCAPKANAKWNQETVVAAIRRFADRYGRAPVQTDFNPHIARWHGLVDAEQKWRTFYEDGDYPTTTTVHDLFGGWNVAIAAAGFEPLPVGIKLADRRNAA